MSRKFVARSILLSLMTLMLGIPLYFLYFKVHETHVITPWPFRLFHSREVIAVLSTTGVEVIGSLVLGVGMIVGFCLGIAKLMEWAEWVKPYDHPDRVAERRRRAEWRSSDW